MTNTLTRLLLTAALCGLFLLSKHRNGTPCPRPIRLHPRMPADSISRDYRLDGVVIRDTASSLAAGKHRRRTVPAADAQQQRTAARFAGSIDPMRILQLMPGVQTAAEETPDSTCAATTPVRTSSC